MNVERLLPDLRCLRCGSPLGYREGRLDCPGCRTFYPVVADIPVLLERDAEARVWEEYFDLLVREKGDTEAANSYINLKNYRFVRKSLLEYLGEIKGLDILDVGCGTGHFSQSLVRDNRLVGIDISFEMARHAMARGLTAAQSSGKKLPLAAGIFDLVIANNVIQSFREGQEFIRELVRVARPGGRILVSATNGQNFGHVLFRLAERKKYRHLGVYSAHRLRHEFHAAGAPVRSVLFLHYLLRKARGRPGDSRLRLIDKCLATTVAVEAFKPNEGSGC
jgi:2-polyprenyl-3-methyl-5-hydroxy-6-metoxy-1,4-benzoquinol methylase